MDETQVALAFAFGAVSTVTLIVVAVRVIRFVVSYGRVRVLSRTRSRRGVSVVNVDSAAGWLRLGSTVLLLVCLVWVTSTGAQQLVFPGVSSFLLTVIPPWALFWGLRGANHALHGMPIRPFLIDRVRILSALSIAALFVLLNFSFGSTAAGIRLWLQVAISPESQDSVQLRESLVAVSGLFLGVGLLSLTPCPWLIKVARSSAHLNAAQLRKRDKRPQLLYLRGFGDDTLRLKAIVSPRRPAIEAIYPIVHDRWESVIAHATDHFGPLVSIARPEGNLRSLGAAREFAPAEGDWLDYVMDEAARSQAIVLSLGLSDGVARELKALKQTELLARTVLVIPPVARKDMDQRWELLCSSIDRPDLLVYRPYGILALVVGQEVTCFSTGRRDEASYRVALRRSLRLVAGNESNPQAVGAEDGASRPSRPGMIQ